jgi:hypothetical protein
MAAQFLAWHTPVQIAEIERALDIERDLDAERALDGEHSLYTQKPLLDRHAEIQHSQQATDRRPVARRRSER